MSSVHALAAEANNSPKGTVSARTVFLFFACLYLLSLGRGFYSSDGDVMFKTAAALAERGSFELAFDPGLPQIVAGQGGRAYSKYDPGLPLLAVPFYVTGDRLAQINQGHRARVAALAVLMIPALAGAGTVAALYRLARRLFGARRGLGVALVAGLATPIWPYARVLFPEVLLAWALTLAAAYLMPRPSPTKSSGADRLKMNLAKSKPVVKKAGRGGRRSVWSPIPPAPFPHRVEKGEGWPPSPSGGEGLGVGMRLGGPPHPDSNREGRISLLHPLSALEPTTREGNRSAVLPFLLRGRQGGEVGTAAFAGGVALGMGMAIRAALAIYVLPLAVLLLWDARSWRERGRRVIWFGAGIVPFVLLLLGHNALRFGEARRFGYAGEGFTTPIYEGAAGLLVSPGKSVLLYAPPLVLSAVLWPRFRRLFPALGAFLASAWIIALLFYGAWWAWYGGWSWGPRFLVPLLPLSTLPLGLLPERRVWRIVAVIVVLLGIGVQLSGVLTDGIAQYGDLAAQDDAGYRLIHWVPRHSPLVGAFGRLIRGDTEPLACFHLSDHGLPRTWVIGTPALLLIGMALGGRRIAWGLMSRP